MRRLLKAMLLRGLRRPFVQAWLQRRLLRQGAVEALRRVLNGMRLMLVLDADFRRNIEGFRGRILFRGADSSFAVAAEFERGKMTVAGDGIDDPNATVTFRDQEALRDFLASNRPDFLNAILTQSLRVEGNLNYVYKFAYMANHLQTALMGG